MLLRDLWFSSMLLDVSRLDVDKARTSVDAFVSLSCLLPGFLLISSKDGSRTAAQLAQLEQHCTMPDSGSVY